MEEKIKMNVNVWSILKGIDNKGNEVKSYKFEHNKQIELNKK